MLDNQIEIWRGRIEKVMIQLNPNQTQQEHREYLKGYIDSLHDTGQISELERETLYMEYGE